MGDVKDLQVSTDELLFSKHQLKLMIVKQLQQKLKSLNQDIVFPFLENNSEQSVDEYIDFLLQHLEKQEMNDMSYFTKDTSLRLITHIDYDKEEILNVEKESN